MSKFRKKPVVIEAVHYLGGGNVENHDTPEWMWHAYENGTLKPTNGSDPLLIATLEGALTVAPGDWIIRGVKGELYPCKPDIFEATYNPADAPPAAPEREPSEAAIEAAMAASDGEYDPEADHGIDWEKVRKILRAAYAAERAGNNCAEYPDVNELLSLEQREEEIAGSGPAEHESEREPLKGERPKVVCLCGSSRFVPEMACIAWGLEKQGRIVLGLHLLPADYPGIQADHQAEAEGVAAKMDALHLRKIDVADEVLVCNIDNYIGDSTRREIAYAEAHGKPVRYLEVAAPKKEGT